MRQPMKRLFYIFAAIATSLSAAYLTVVMLAQSRGAMAEISRQFDSFTQRNVRIKTEEAVRECQAVQRSISANFDEALSNVRGELAALGPAQVGSGYVWINARGQNGAGKSARIEVPIPVFGDTPIVPEKDKNDNPVKNCKISERIFDRIQNGKKIHASIMTKTNAAGEMLRVATTLKDADGRLLLGTKPEDSSEPAAIAHSMLARKTYTGIQNIAGRPYISVCEPLLDQYGEVIGAVEFLKDFNDIGFVFENLESVRIGDDGYLWGIRIGSAGDHSLQFCRERLMGAESESGAINFNEVGSSPDEIVDAAISAGENKILFRPSENYDGLSRRGNSAVIAFAYFKPWKMVIGATLHRENFESRLIDIELAVKNRPLYSMPIAIFSVMVSMIFAAIFVGKISSQPKKIMSAIDDMKLFDEKSAHRKLIEERESEYISIAETETLRIEVLKCAKFISRYVLRLSTLSADILEKAAKMNERVCSIMAQMDDKMAKLSEVQNALAVISKTAAVLNEDSGAALEGMGNSLEEMKEGSNLLLQLEENAKALIADSQNVEFQLSEVKDKADKVAAVAADIRTVSDRINMLAVNASIEAERSKDASGFKSVAAEVTKLSDTTALSASRISDTASGMCDSVNSGVDEMKNFSLIMLGCKESIKSVRQMISTAQRTTFELSPKFKDISRGIYSHAQSVSAIEEGVNKLYSRAVESKAISARLKSDIDTLSATAEAIKQRMRYFKTI